MLYECNGTHYQRPPLTLLVAVACPTQVLAWTCGRVQVGQEGKGVQQCGVSPGVICSPLLPCRTCPTHLLLPQLLPLPSIRTVCCTLTARQIDKVDSGSGDCRRPVPATAATSSSTCRCLPWLHRVRLRAGICTTRTGRHTRKRK